MEIYRTYRRIRNNVMPYVHAAKSRAGAFPYDIRFALFSEEAHLLDLDQEAKRGRVFIHRDGEIDFRTYDGRPVFLNPEQHIIVRFPQKI